MLIVLRLLATVAFVLAGCELLPGFQQDGIQRDPIQQDEAIEIALQFTQVLEPVVTQVRLGGLIELSGDPGFADSIVWAVTVHGWTSVCPPNVVRCAEGVGVSTIYVEHETGDWIEITNGRLRPN